MEKGIGRENDIRQNSNTKLKYFYVLECGVAICCFGLLVAMIVMFCGLKNILINKFLESNIKQDDSYFATDVRNLDLDIKDGDDFSFNYKKEVVEKNDNVKIWILVCLVALFLISFLFLFFSVNCIYDCIALHKKLYFLNEKYKDAVERYAGRVKPVHEKQTTRKDNNESIISEKDYPDMKELFKVYSNTLLEL